MSIRTDPSPAGSPRRRARQAGGGRAPRGSAARRRFGVADPRRLAPLAALAALAFLAGAVLGGRHVPSEQRVARSFAAAWERGDYAAMHSLLSAAARRRLALPALARAYRDAATVLTLTRVRAGRARGAPHGAVALPVTLATRIFGRLSGTVVLPMADRGDGQPGVDWRPSLLAPGLRPGERLSRETRLPARAAIEARDGSALARGAARVSDIGPAAADVVGSVGPPPAGRAALLAARGFPPRAVVGRTGLERQFDDRLAGTPGGTLLAGRRVLATSVPRPGATVRTTIDPAVQRAAVTALADRGGDDRHLERRREDLPLADRGRADR